MADQHRIKRLEVALRVADQASARELQQQVSTFCRTELPDLLQSAFDGIATDRWLRIDHLELSLPAFTSVDEFRSRLGERVRQVLQTRMDDAVAAAAAVAGNAVPVTGRKAPPQAFDAAYQAADAFIHILEYGVMPWHSAAADFDDAVHAVIEILNTDRAFGLQLATLLAERPKALNRFVMQTKGPDRRRMVALITRADESLIEDIEKALNTVVDALIMGGAPLPEKARLVGETTVRNLIRHQPIDQETLVFMLDELLGSVLDARGDRAQPILNDLPLAGMRLEAVLPRRWHPALRRSIVAFADSVPAPGNGTMDAADPETIADAGSISIERGDTDIPAPQGIPEKDSVEMPLGEAPGRKAQPEDNLPLPAQPREFDSVFAALPQDAGAAKPLTSAQGQKGAGHRPKTTRSGLGPADHPSDPNWPAGPGSAEPPRVPDPSEGLPWRSPFEAEAFHITNAGLVLLAPFFGMVFKDLGYLDERRDFIFPEARVRAVHFSQFLVTAEQHPAECHLVLNKILCGMDAAEAVERFVDLTVQEHAAAAEVLDSAIEHWSVLKRTSAPVFRQTFLQHAGILSGRSGNWLLRVERTPVDVLIDTLPWTISIIKHPWMPQPLMVEW
jgi:hypothetical protein